MIENKTQRRAFSLVELSIVLVILGLLVGGVLSGQSLIHAAELRAVATEYSKFSGAVNSFRDKYFAIPGDMANATAFWGAVNADHATCVVTAGTGMQTCNGDGNGKLDTDNATHYDYSYVWQHLANAGLVEGSFAGSNASNELPMPSRFPATRWQASYSDSVAANSDVRYFGGEYGNLLTTLTTGSTRNNSGVMKPEDAWNIDSKLDDGMINSGRVVARKTTCSTGGGVVSDTATYDFSQTSPVCTLLFRRSF